MNLKVLTDIYNTLVDMNSSLYYLGWFAGIHTATFICFLAYKRFKETIIPDTDQELQMVSLETETEEKNVLYNSLISKRTELIQLIKHLDDIQSNITSIRDRLQSLNIST